LLQAYGYINEEERATLDQRQDLEGDAAYDIGLANLMVRDALDKNPDALITITTPVSQLAVNATLEMDDPPIIVFNVVPNPYVAGIADAPCIKPAHVSASQFLAPYDRIVPLMLLQNPDMQVANEHRLPVMYTAGNAVYRGATIGAGVYSYFKEGVIAARMLLAHWEGAMDIAAAGINLQNDMSVGVNLDVAADQGLEISPEVLAAADFVVEDGQSSEGVTPGLPEVNPYLDDMTVDQRRAVDLAFLETLRCTDEMIAEQQAQLDADSE